MTVTWLWICKLLIAISDSTPLASRCGNQKALLSFGSNFLTQRSTLLLIKFISFQCEIWMGNILTMRYTFRITCSSVHHSDHNQWTIFTCQWSNLRWKMRTSSGGGMFLAAIHSRRWQSSLYSTQMWIQANQSPWLDHQASTHRTAFLEALDNQANQIPAKALLASSLKKSGTGHLKSNQTKSAYSAIVKSTLYHLTRQISS